MFIQDGSLVRICPDISWYICHTYGQSQTVVRFMLAISTFMLANSRTLKNCWWTIMTQNRRRLDFEGIKPYIWPSMLLYRSARVRDQTINRMRSQNSTSHSYWTESQVCLALPVYIQFNGNPFCPSWPVLIPSRFSPRVVGSPSFSGELCYSTVFYSMIPQHEPPHPSAQWSSSYHHCKTSCRIK